MSGAAQREDLAGLTDAQLATLANAGLLKRARREVDAGRGPSVTLRPDGTVVGESPDGAVTEIGADIQHKLGTCSCGALRACRHRVATVLVFRSQAGEGDAQPWDPGSLSDADLETHLGPAMVAEAHALVARSIAVRLKSGSIPVAELPTATVSFWVPHALALARCDCGEAPCPHLAVAVWAFRDAARAEDDLVVLGAGRAFEQGATLGRVHDALALLADEGLAALGDTRMLSEARAAAHDDKLAWLGDALEDLEREKDRYDRRSTVFRVDRAVRCVAELVARSRAARAAEPALPPSYVLGANAAGAGKVDSLRLIGIGASIDADGPLRSARVHFVEPISGTVLALHKTWRFEQQDAPAGRALGDLFASSRRSLRDLATGYTLVRGAKRRDNGWLDLDRARSLRPSQPAGAMWEEITPPVRITSLADHLQRSAERPPDLLAPRLVGRDVHVLPIAGVLDIGYSPAHQELRAQVTDAEGTPYRLTIPHRAACPGRIDAVQRCLQGGAPLVAGRLSRDGEDITLDVFAFLDAHARVIVPDIEAPRPLDRPSPGALFATHERQDVFTALHHLVERGIHRGLPAIRRRALPELAARFDQAGLMRMAAICRRAIADREAFFDLTIASVVAREQSAANVTAHRITKER